MRPSRSILNRAKANQQARRMNELDLVVRNTMDIPRFEHRDGFSATEIAWQPSRSELHIGFRTD